ncbi:asparagine synthase (glutamine-hydrolyzing) [bacterium]|nr:asparagine synthase (glutamine-hydrolyzing) [bacterium]
MCGIAGYLNRDPRRPAETGPVVRMCDAIVHRGPDDAGYHADGPLAMGMRRLSIIDLAGGHQPIANEDQTVWIVFNGEIYNHDELRAGLKARGHAFRTHTDTEVIVHLWEEHGVDCVQHLRGMFGFAIWDSRTGEFFLVRDRLGIKPMFYVQTDERLAFASEIKALFALDDVPREPDWTGIDAYFSYSYIPAPLTGFAGISKLPAAHYLHVRDGRTEIRRYWDLEFAPKSGARPGQLVDELVAISEEAVRLRLMSEVPLGAFLSGGVDSSLVVALMAGSSQEAIRTFTMGFAGSKGDFLDETPYAREVSAAFGTRHTETAVEPRIERALRAGIAAFDEPFADDSLIPTFHICEEAAKAVTVIMTGLGGDENFAGYERYLGFRFSELYRRVPGFLRQGVIRPVVNALKEEKGGHYRINHLKRFVAAGELDLARRWQSYICVRPQAERRRLYAPEIAAQIDFDRVDSLGWEHFERLGEGDALDRALYQDINMYLPEDILALSDRVGMAHSLELRVPLIDHVLVEFCAKIPSELKIKGTEKKHLLRRAARGIVPDSVLDHRKQGFASPMAAWLRGDLRPMVDRMLAPEVLRGDGLFDPAFVGGAVDDHLARRQLNDKLLFALLAFQTWWRDGARSGSPA